MIQAAAYWGPGAGPVGAEAIAALSSTWDLAERLTLSRTWYRAGERATRPVTPDDLSELLSEGSNLSDDTPPRVMTDLGRRVRLWDGEDGGGELSLLSRAPHRPGVAAPCSSTRSCPQLQMTRGRYCRR